MVHYLHAFFAWCPYCRSPTDGHVGRFLLTSDPKEAADAQRLGVPDPAVYSEPVPVGAGNDVHFIQCGLCTRSFVVRLGPRPSDLERYRTWKANSKYNTWTKSSPPKVHQEWGSVTFKEWMREVILNPNPLLRGKAIRECEKRGIMLNWRAVATEVGEAVGSGTSPPGSRG